MVRRLVWRLVSRWVRRLVSRWVRRLVSRWVVAGWLHGWGLERNLLVDDDSGVGVGWYAWTVNIALGPGHLHLLQQ